MEPIDGRWPPIYDADELAATISALVQRGVAASQFYASVKRGPAVCQGDIFTLPSGVPVIDENGEPVAFGDATYWLVIGNTCDFDRAIAEVAWTQAVPITNLGLEITPNELSALTSYKYSRRFYLPPWDSGVVGHCVADFLRPVAVHKAVFGTQAVVTARLDRPAWILLHSCLIRFLARDDGRFA